MTTDTRDRQPRIAGHRSSTGFALSGDAVAIQQLVRPGRCLLPDSQAPILFSATTTSGDPAMDLIDRAKKIMINPQAEWRVIDDETIDTPTLYKRYIMPLAAIGPVAWLLGMSVVGFGGWRAPFLGGIATAIVNYALVLGSVFVIARIVDALAPTFGATPNPMQSMKLVAYAATSAWLGGIFGLIPELSIIGVLFSIYSLYLLYLGIPVLMKAPPDRALAYTAVIVVAAIVVSFVIGAIIGAFTVRPPGIM